MYKAHRRPRFHIIGIEGLLESLETTWNCLGE